MIYDISYTYIKLYIILILYNKYCYTCMGGDNQSIFIGVDDLCTHHADPQFPWSMGSMENPLPRGWQWRVAEGQREGDQAAYCALTSWIHKQKQHIQWSPRVWSVLFFVNSCTPLTASQAVGWPADCFKDWRYLPPPVVPQKASHRIRWQWLERHYRPWLLKRWDIPGW